MTERAAPTIARISPRVTPFVGGLEIHVEQLALAVRNRGLRQLVVCSEGTIAAEGIRVIAAPAGRRWGTMIHDLMFGRSAQRALQRETFDLVHSHGDAFVARAGAAVASRRNVPHVHTMHGGVVPHVGKRTLLSLAVPRGSTYLAVSRDVAAELAEYGIPPRNIFVRPSGVRCEFFDVPFGDQRTGIVVGGRLVPSKGILEFARAWAVASPGAPLTVFGDGPQRSQFEILSRSAADVVYTGPLDAATLAKVFAGASLGVVIGTASSGHVGGEGTPTVGLEMLSAGCLPLVAGRVGELGSIVAKLDPRLMVSSVPSPVEVLRAQASIEQDVDLRVQARRLLHDGYAWDRVAGSVIDLYVAEIARFAT